MSLILRILVFICGGIIGIRSLRSFFGIARKPSYHQNFLDTADIKLWDRYMPMGIFYGITTNPVLLERAGVSCDHKSLKELANIAIDKHKVSCFMLQTWGDTESLVSNGIQLADISKRVVVKVPLTPSGILAASALIERRIRVCMTACYSKDQVFTSAALGAGYQ